MSDSQWVRDVTAQVQQYSEGQYINFAAFDKPEDTQQSFPAANWVRVQAAKLTYDPYNLFRDLNFYRSDGGYGAQDASNSQVEAVAQGG